MSTRLRRYLSTLLALFSFVHSSFAEGAREGGIVGKMAPLWEVDEWKQLPEGAKSLEITDFKGKTIYLYAFQSWCPGCHSHGFPTLKAVQERFKEDKNVVFLAIQTVFEGHSTNTMARGIETLKKFGLEIPLGLSGTKAEPSKLMRSYRTRGTPWTILIDRHGKVVFDGFRVEAAGAIDLIEKSESDRK